MTLQEITNLPGMQILQSLPDTNFIKDNPRMKTFEHEEAYSSKNNNIPKENYYCFKTKDTQKSKRSGRF